MIKKTSILIVHLFLANKNIMDIKTTIFLNKVLINHSLEYRDQQKILIIKV